MSSRKHKAQIRIQSKRNVELWIYSFADMYMIMSVFFIALAVIYATKSRETLEHRERITTAGRGPASVVSDIQVDFPSGSADLTAQAIEDLELFLPVLKGVRKGQIDVEGYADGVAPKKDSVFSSNLDLSTRRAVSVAEWLIGNGIASRNVRVFGYGSGQVYSKAQVGTNRRVVVKVSTGEVE